MIDSAGNVVGFMRACNYFSPFIILELLRGISFIGKVTFIKKHNRMLKAELKWPDKVLCACIFLYGLFFYLVYFLANTFFIQVLILSCLNRLLWPRHFCIFQDKKCICLVISFLLNIQLDDYCLTNGQIKKLDPVSKKVVTIAGTGNAGFKDGAALSAQVQFFPFFSIFCKIKWLFLK